MSITLAQYQDRLADMFRITSEDVVAGLIIPSANILLGSIKNRIMLDGKGSDDSKLTDYSSKPAYFGKEAFVKRSMFKAAGKDNKKTLVGAKTMYIRDGYKGLRDIQGMPTDVKNLVYSGDMMRSFILGRDGDKVILGFNSDEQSKKRKWQEEREKKTIFSATQKEKDEYRKYFYDGYSELAKKHLQ